MSVASLAEEEEDKSLHEIIFSKPVGFSTVTEGTLPCEIFILLFSPVTVKLCCQGLTPVPLRPNLFEPSQTTSSQR